ncbi:MAG: (3R)-hydroxymyristoyl-[acyl-carrier-protein] dehydratase [Candidatus Magnetoglobus multicellularis str. Araruama]|uniref:3-hydroxyacyl-[acyl-carrier-protein] dehydratase FabZ n=1 Tax=Candidatus Magnetoglobus multicellularis str. Araruama TaxID=890399 RepID=A0A1V1PER8_9BACT|nr:MAG: (3R)-hydroxymyristoyl-[acyl-carrier-protein] dehydratase [Candidatus Magnetoglobus multicellularis str. Araruama]
MHYDIDEILKRVPHRYPFIMVDRIVSYMPSKHIVGVKNVSINEPYFQGHFPDRPIMPGVLIIEALAQTGAVMAYDELVRFQPDKFLYLSGMNKVRFRKAVVPGDQLKMDLHVVRIRKQAIKMRGLAIVEDKTVAEAELIALLC